MLAAKPLDSVSRVNNGTQLLCTKMDISTNTRRRADDILLVEDDPFAQSLGGTVLSINGEQVHITGDEAGGIDQLEQLIHSSEGKVEVWLDNTFPTISGDNRGSHAILRYIMDNEYQDRVRIVTFGGSREENLAVIRMCIKHGIPVSFDARIKHEKLAAPKPGDLGVVMKTITDLRTAANKETTHLPLAA